ncbi:MAG TPA: glutamate racemase [Spirochaetes bacterium]|nr:glutamate racemase [Spirochaetota bacterium]
MSDQPIGVFDSGIGGLGIFKAIQKLLPYESLIYFADRDRCPYGSKTQEEIRAITKSITVYLLDEHKVKMVVAACNTATVSSIEYLREQFPELPIIGVVPVIKPASLLSQTGKIACLATDATVKSEAQANLIQDYAVGQDVEVYNIACHGLVELIEKGLENDEITEKLKEYLNPLSGREIDAIALGCTHYTLIRPEVERLVPEGIRVMDSNEPVAKQVKRVLTEGDLLSQNQDRQYQYFVNGDTAHFNSLVQPILNGLFSEAQRVQMP